MRTSRSSPRTRYTDELSAAFASCRVRGTSRCHTSPTEHGVAQSHFWKVMAGEASPTLKWLDKVATDARCRPTRAVAAADADGSKLALRVGAMRGGMSSSIRSGSFAPSWCLPRRIDASDAFRSSLSKETVQYERSRLRDRSDRRDPQCDAYRQPARVYVTGRGRSGVRRLGTERHTQVAPIQPSPLHRC